MAMVWHNDSGVQPITIFVVSLDDVQDDLPSSLRKKASSIERYEVRGARLLPMRKVPSADFEFVSNAI